MSLTRENCALAIVVDSPDDPSTQHITGISHADAASLLAATIADLDERFGGDSEPMQVLWCVPDRDALAEFALQGRVRRVPALEPGPRRAAALHEATWLGFSHVAIMGPDAPHVPNDVVYGALGQTAQYDVVLGASDDGTTYMVGVRDGADVFSDVRFGSTDEMGDIVAAAGAAGLAIAPLVGNFSVRTAADLPRLIEYLQRHRGVKATRVLDVCRRIVSA